MGRCCLIKLTTAKLAARVTEFWSNVATRAQHECWEWTGYTEDGYGRFFFEGKMKPAHELALTFTTGEVRADGLDTCHSCNRPICCNPAHLRFDTRQGNVDDAVEAGRNYRPPRRFSADEVAKIRQRLERGATQKSLANQYGISDSMVSMIKTGKRYKINA